jgi:hypothetical protein
MPPVSERAHVRRALPSKTAWSREGADVERRLGEDTWQVSARVMELLQVMSLLLLKALLKVFVLLKVSLLKVSEVLSLSSPLTQTTMPQTRPGGA